MFEAVSELTAYASVLSLVLLAGVGAIAVWRWTASLLWLAAWNWAKCRGVVRAVRGGWNSGPPPEGEWVMVLDGVGHEFMGRGRMIRDDDRMYTPNGGYSMPVSNCTGWLLCIDPPKERSE